jgi:hypothetical protein
LGNPGEFWTGDMMKAILIDEISTGTHNSKQCILIPTNSSIFTPNTLHRGSNQHIVHRQWLLPLHPLVPPSPISGRTLFMIDVPMRIVFFRPNKSPTITAMIAPKKQPILYNAVTVSIMDVLPLSVRVSRESCVTITPPVKSISS